MTKVELVEEIVKLETRYVDMLKLISIYDTQMFASTDLEQIKFWCNELLDKACILDKERSAVLRYTRNIKTPKPLEDPVDKKENK